MAKYKNRSAEGKGASLPDAEGDESFETETPGLDNGREDSGSGVGAGEVKTNAFPLTLEYPKEEIAVWEHFAASLDKFQASLIHSKDDALKALRITACEAPSPTVPKVHKTPYAGFAVTQADTFKIRLSNGRYITSTKE